MTDKNDKKQKKNYTNLTKIKKKTISLFINKITRTKTELKNKK